MVANSQLRAMAREQLKGNWGIAILVYFLYSLIVGGISLIKYLFLGSLIAFLISGALTLGLYLFFIKLVRGEHRAVADMFAGFHSFGKALLLSILIIIFTFLWFLLLIIPGIIAGFRYSQAYYILNDHPELSALEAIERSKEMMKGYKWKLFLLYLSFIGWALLCIITFGIGYLWLGPYVQTSSANFYNELKQASSHDETAF